MNDLTCRVCGRRISYPQISFCDTTCMATFFIRKEIKKQFAAVRKEMVERDGQVSK